MNFKTISPSHRIQRFNVLTLFISLSLSFLLFLILHSPIYSISITFLKSLEEKRTRQSFLFSFFSTYYTYISTEYLPYAIVILIYNYGNIYKTFILFSQILLGKYITGFLRLIFIDTPLYYDKSIPFSIINEHTFSFPSEKLVIYPTFLLSLWKILTRKLQKNQNELYLKYFFLGVISLFIGMLFLSELILGVSSIDQSLFSLGISLQIYYLIFYVVKVNYNDNKQFFRIIKSNFKKILCLIIILLCLPVFVYFLRRNSQTIQKLTESITSQNKSENEICFEKEALSTSFVFSSVLFMFIGFKLEINLLFHEQFSNWSQFNFEPNDEFNHSYSTGSYSSSLSERISITKGAQWNHTKIFQSFFRLIIICLLVAVCFSPYFFVKWGDNFFLVIFVKDILCWGIVSFGWTFWFKLIIQFLSLSNTTLWSVLRESI